MTALPPSLHRSSLHPTRLHPQTGGTRREPEVYSAYGDDDDKPVAGLGMLLAAIAGAALITATLVGAVWVRMAEVQAGYAIHTLQRKTVKLRQARSSLQVEVATLKRHDRLAEVAENKLGLVPPNAADVKRLSEFRAISKKAEAK